MNVFLVCFQATAGICTALLLIFMVAVVLLDLYYYVGSWIDGEEDTEDLVAEDDDDVDL